MQSTLLFIDEIKTDRARKGGETAYADPLKSLAEDFDRATKKAEDFIEDLTGFLIERGLAAADAKWPYAQSNFDAPEENEPS